MDRQAHVPAGHQPLLAVLHDSPSPAHAPLMCARTGTGRPTSPQGTNHSSLSCMTLLLSPTLPSAPHQGSRAGLTWHGLHVFTLPHSTACPPCRRPHYLSTAPAPHQGSRAGSTQHGPDRVDPVTLAACTGQLAPLHACLAAARTTLALHRQCNRDLGPDRLGMVQAPGRVDPVTHAACMRTLECASLSATIGHELP